MCYNYYGDNMIEKILGIFKKRKTEDVKEEVCLDQKKVLMIDDNQLNLKAATILLEEYNIIVKTCPSGTDAIELLEREKDFTLILMDNMMPGLTGTETLKLLKQDPNFKIPIVALTAYDTVGEEEKLLKSGFDYFLKKPLKRDELDVILKKIIKFKKILIVDDNKFTLKISDKFLRKYNVETNLATSGEECLKMLDNNYDLIFLDDMMPGMSGANTLAEMKKRNINTSVVVLTGNTEEGAEEKYYEQGFDDYLSKPIDDEELEIILKENL